MSVERVTFNERTGSTNKTDEGDLVEKLRNGDRESYETLVLLYSGRMLATARRFLWNEDDARDAVQDSFFKAFRAIQTFRGDSCLGTWLHRIVVNTALMRLRSDRRRKQVSIEEYLPVLDEQGSVSHQAEPWRDAESLLLRKETRALVRECIARLPDTYRVVLLLRDIEELNTSQTARRLTITENAVKIRLCRARQALRMQLRNIPRVDKSRAA